MHLLGKNIEFCNKKHAKAQFILLKILYINISCIGRCIMVALGPSSLDLLTTQGILPYDAQEFVTGEPSAYLQQYGYYPPGQSVSSAGLPANSLSPLQPLSPLQQQPIVDSYNPAKLMKEKNSEGSIIYKLKTIGASALALYILGFICSKGKKNPIDGIKGIYNVCASVVKWIGKIFKKS